MFSMTGYGKGEYKEGGIELTVEIKTVNNRYLDISVKSPKSFNCYEETVRSLVRGSLSRGHADVFIGFTDRRERALRLAVDESAARAYVEAARRVKALFPDIPDDFTLTALLRSGDVLRTEEEGGEDEQVGQALAAAVSAALEKLNAMRAVEGEKLAADMHARMDTIEGLVANIAARAPLVAEHYRTKLTERMREALADLPVDEARILSEAAVFADKCNIDEELTRLRSHISQFRSICREARVGRKLDFLVQEFNREANTICSKSNDIAVTNAALALKNEIEKIREQVQNVE